MARCIEALFAIRGYEAQWEATIAAARLEPDSHKSCTLVQLAFDHFRDKTFEVVRSEMSEYFKAAQPPTTQGND